MDVLSDLNRFARSAWAPQLPFKAGSTRYIGNSPNSATLTTLAGAANRIDLAPWICPVDITTDQLGTLCSTLVASAQGKIVVYDSDAAGLPNNLLLETGTLDFGSTGFKSVAGALTFNKGAVYWLGIRHSSTATLNTHQTYTMPNLDWGTAPTSATAYKVLRRTLAFATGAPNPWVFSAAEATAATPPAIFLRQA